MADTIITVGGDLTQLERQIQDVLSRNFRLSGLDTKGFVQPLGKIRGQLGEFEKSLEASNARVVAFGASAGAIYLLGDAFKGLVRSTIEVEKSLADINTVLNESEGNLKRFGNEVFNVANATSQSFETAAQAALEFSRQGLGLEETLKRTSAALTLAKISGLSAADSVEALTATINSFNDAALTDIQIVNKLAAVDARYAVSSADLAEAIKRVGSSASEAGVSLDQLIALVTSAQQTTARGGAVIGNSFKTIFTRIQRPKVLESLNELGIQTQNVAGQTLPLIQILTQLAKTYDSLSSAQKSQVAELVGGVYQINILKAVVGDLSKEFGSTYAGALRASSTATNEAEKRISSLAQTLDSQINRVFNNLKRAGSIIGDLTIAPALERVLGAANNILETFALGKEPESYGEKAAVGFLKGLGNFIAGPGLLIAAVGAFQIFKRLASFVSDAGRTILGLGEAAQKQAQIQAQILQLLQRNPALYSQIQSGAISVQDAAQGYLNIVNLTNQALEKQRALAAQIAQAAVSGAAGGGPVGGGGGGGGPRRGSRRRASSGFIPNFADEGQMLESVGAANHKNGYKAGQAYQTTIHDGRGKSFRSWVNSAEDVKTFTNAAGYKATIVRPPNGFGPGTQMAAKGFIPNFAKKQGRKKVDLGAKGKEFEKLINYYLTNEAISAGTALLDFPYPSNSLTNASAQNKARISLNSASVFGDAKIKSASYSRKDLIKKLVGSLDANSYKTLIKQAENSTGDFINLNRFLPAKPSLISSKNIITPDQLNATASAELGNDVVLNLSRLYKNPVTHSLTENGFHKRLLLNYIEDYVTIPNFSSGFIPNFAAGDGSLSLSEYAANKGKSIKQLVPASLNAAYSKGVSAKEINKYFPAWQYKGATVQEAARRTGASQAQKQKLKEEFAFNKKLIKEIVIPWDKTAADFGGNNAAFGDAYESHVFKFLKNKYGDRFKTATELGLVGTRTKDGQIVDRNFADVEGALLDRRGRVMMWFDAKAQSKAGQLAYSRTGKGGVADKFFRAEAKNPNLRLNPRRVAAVFRNRLSSGFIPNFAPLNKNILRDMVRLNILNASSPIKNSKNVELSRSVRGGTKRWQELSKKYNKNIPQNEIVNTVFASRYQETGNPFFEKRFMGQTIEDTIKRHQDNALDFQADFGFDKTPFVSTSYEKGKAYAHSMITGGKIVEQKKIRLSRILNKQAYSLLVDKYGEEQVKETILNLSKLRGKKGIAFDVNDFLKTHYEMLASKGKFESRSRENEIAILNKGFIPNLAKIKSKFGKATIGKTDPIDLEFFGKSIGKKINSSQIASIEDLTTVGKGNAGALYSDIASSIKGKGGLFGYALAQNRSVDPKKMKDPLARLKAKYPQIAQRIKLGGQTYISGDYGKTVIKASSLKDLEINQDKILRMIDPAVLTLKAFSSGFIPNFNSALNDAINREMDAGYSKSQIRIGKSASLATGLNPEGYGVYNSTEGSLQRGMSLAQKAGINPKTKGMSRGFIPNFAYANSRVGKFTEEEFFSKNVGGTYSDEARRAADIGNRERANPFDAEMARRRKSQEETLRKLQEKANQTKKFTPTPEYIKLKERLASIRKLKARPGTAGEGAAAGAAEGRILARLKEMEGSSSSSEEAALAQKKLESKRKAFAAENAEFERQRKIREAEIKARSDETRAKMAERMGGDKNDPAKNYERFQKSVRRQQEKKAKREQATSKGAGTTPPTAGGAGGGGGTMPPGGGTTAGGRGAMPPGGGPPGGGPPGGGARRGPRASGGAKPSRGFLGKLGRGGAAGGFVRMLVAQAIFNNLPDIASALGAKVYEDEDKGTLTKTGRAIESFASAAGTAAFYLDPSFLGMGKDLAKKARGGLGKVAGGVSPSLNRNIKTPSILGKITDTLEKAGSKLGKPGSKLSKFGGAFGKRIPVVGTALAAAGGLFEGARRSSQGASFAESLILGGLPAIGSILGTAGGALLGSFGGPVGTFAGGAAGGYAGGKLGSGIAGAIIGKQRIAQLDQAGSDKAYFENEISKYKTESGKNLATYNYMRQAQAGEFGVDTKDVLSSSMFGGKEFAKRFDYGEARRGAAGMIAESVGGIKNAETVFDKTGQGKGKAAIDKFAEEIYKELERQGKETGGLKFNKAEYEALRNRNNAAEQGAKGVKALTDEEKRLLETYKTARDVAGQLIKNIERMKDLERVGKVFETTRKGIEGLAKAIAEKASKEAAAYKVVQEKEKERGDLLKKNYGGGVEGYMNPEENLKSINKIAKSLRVLNDPRLRNNQIERGRAAIGLSEGATEMGINIPQQFQTQLNRQIETGFAAYQGQNLRYIGNMAGGYRNSFGIQQGINESAIAMRAFATQQGEGSIQSAMLTENKGVGLSGYRSAREEGLMKISPEEMKRREEQTQKTLEKLQETIDRLAGLQESVAKGLITKEQYEAISRSITEATKNFSGKRLEDELQKIFETLPQKIREGLDKVGSGGGQTNNTVVTSKVELDLSDDAKAFVKQRNTPTSPTETASTNTFNSPMPPSAASSIPSSTVGYFQPPKNPRA